MFEKEYDSNVTNEELEAMGAGALRMAAKEGDVDSGSVMCGQIAGIVKEKMTCKDIILDVITEAEELLKGANTWVK